MSLIPSGTVRSQFSARDASQLDQTLATIAYIAGREQFDPALVWTAKRLVANEFEDAPKTASQWHATLATLALLIAIEEGSTRLPLQKPAHLDHILQRLQTRLSAVAAEIAAAQPSKATALETAASALGRVRDEDPTEMLDPSRLATVLGVATEDTLPYRPLLLSGDAGGTGHALTSERMLRKERSLADAFASLVSVETLSGKPVSSKLDAREYMVASQDLHDAVTDLADTPTRYRADGRWHQQQLNPEQANAVLLAALEPLALVTGGPGTGKTSIIVSVLRLLTRLGVEPADIALAAPTGKAAFRMRESIDQQLASLSLEDQPVEGQSNKGHSLPAADQTLRTALPDARTIHRLLGYSPSQDRFWRNADNRLEASVVICDEASMIDLELMHALIQALPDDARLVLVGDADQLPSVAGGAVFRDLVADTSLVDPRRHTLIETLADKPIKAANADAGDPMASFTARLHHSYRMQADDHHGSQILELARTVRDCQRTDDPELAATLKQPVELAAIERFGGVHRLTAQTDRNAFVERWFQDFIATLPHRRGGTDAGTFQTSNGEFLPDSQHDLERLFDHYAKARILCVTQVFRTGARAINRAMHAHFADHAGHNTSTHFLHLEPVIAQQNNYDLGVYNGDQGVVVYVSERGQSGRSKRAVFPRPDGGFRAIGLSQISHQLEHAFATSIHKAQGSEFDHVAVVMPDENLPMLTKQLLYTAVTRASKSVTLFDTAKLFEAGAATPVRRFTGLPQRLANVLRRKKTAVEQAESADAMG
jgi:exodeoxyribonuclease V alpha subunit